MAGVNKVEVRMLGMAAVAAVLLMMAVAVVARPAKLKDIRCRTSDEYVYPYLSLCDSPAELSTGYSYIDNGGLAPEYDETNATYYVRLTDVDSAATYVAVTESLDIDTVLVNSTVYIYNADSKRALTWRQEGSDEYFLIEQEVISSVLTEGARFRFLLADEVSVPCPAVYPRPECHTYYLVSDLGTSSTSGTSGAGLQVYEEGSVTYIKAAAEGSTGDLPIFVIRASSGRSTSAMPFPIIRSVTARE